MARDRIIAGTAFFSAQYLLWPPVATASVARISSSVRHALGAAAALPGAAVATCAVLTNASAVCEGMASEATLWRGGIWTTAFRSCAKRFRITFPRQWTGHARLLHAAAEPIRKCERNVRGRATTISRIA